ncbi:MAG: beta-galactosidase, partial [Victivallales bacterium]|nr:beta-galactosidase [Victivallales bacterium]
MTEQVLQTGLERIGTLAADKDAASKGSCWMLGCETLDRDFADFQEYKNYIPALGIPLIRLQAGWAKTEKTKGVYDFSWLDRIVNDAKELGLRCLLETDYGNSIYEGGGGTDLSGGFPSTEEAWNAWDAWVTNLVLHFKDRVHEWAMWNEPDNRREVTAEEIASLNIRTAKIIRKHQPDAFIAGLSLARSDAEGFHYCLSQIREQGGEDLFDSYIYHGYRYNPDDASENGLRIKNMMKQYGFKGVLWQGENGCPS